ncbi:MAG: NUDIX domain-containing protein [Bdellovibrionota bacterium]
MTNKVGVGIGVIILNESNQILLGLRKGRHGGLYGLPGGMLDLGETFEECSKREVMEETGIILNNAEVIAVTNNIKTMQNENIHNVSIILLSRQFSGEPKNMEPEKCEGWNWFNLEQLPKPIFEGSLSGIKCFINKNFYLCS